MPTVTAPAMPRAMPRSRYPSTASRSVAHSQPPAVTPPDQEQTVTLNGYFGPGTHSVSVRFLNDA